MKAILMIINIINRSVALAIKAETSGLPALVDGVAEIIERVEELHTGETSTLFYQGKSVPCPNNTLT